MGLNKIQLKALVFKCIDPLRNLAACDDALINATLSKLRQIKDADFEFIARILIKEANSNNRKIAAIFVYLAEALSPECFLGLVMRELNSNSVSDDKKMFLINMLAGFGIQIDPESAAAFFCNPEEVVNLEAAKFLENAKTDPEAQIDFLDFYFVSPNGDKKDLINTIIEDDDPDRVVNILSPIALSDEDTTSVLYYIDIFNEKKSLHSIKPLRYFSNYPNQKISKKAARILRKMQMQGFYTESALIKFYKSLLSEFDPPDVQISMPDGNSNFSMVITRKTKNNACFIFFIAINLELGPFSSFGFSSVTKNDLEKITQRFFSNMDEISIPPEYAKKILDTLVLKRISLNKIVPYEYYCWERIMDDIPLMDVSYNSILASGLEKIELNEAEKKVIYKAPYVSNWFYRSSKNNSPSSCLIEKAVQLNEENLPDIENLISEYAKMENIINNLKNRLLFLAFCLKQKGAEDFANVYYSLSLNDNEMLEFAKFVLKRSVYEYMLSLKFPNEKNKSCFAAPKGAPAFDVDMFINYIEKNWVE